MYVVRDVRHLDGWGYYVPPVAAPTMAHVTVCRLAMRRLPNVGLSRTKAMSCRYQLTIELMGALTIMQGTVTVR